MTKAEQRKLKRRIDRANEALAELLSDAPPPDEWAKSYGGTDDEEDE